MVASEDNEAHTRLHSRVPQHRIVPVRREYNKWVANETLEDYALRFTAKKARRWSSFRVANTAIGAISFLALEAIGGAITLTYGFTNAIAAILVVGILIFLTALPISYHAARSGIDIDLLTRGAGFGYIGSTITSIIYASFTFIFFAIEAAIMAKALEMGIGLPEAYGYLVSALIVIPLATHGFTFISRFQVWTQPLWLVLHILPFAFIAANDDGTISAWTQFTGRLGPLDNSFDLALFGAASAVCFSLIAQIGEQVDILRFLPRQRAGRRSEWWVALISAGPGWIILGMIKLIAGSFLAYLAFRHGVPPVDAAEPTHMYFVAFGYVISDSRAALALAVLFVIVSQLKINVTNSYAGSIAWSNFFSRLTHSHPGRVVWLVFNVLIALTLMELGIYKALEQILGIYSLVAVAWVGAIVSDLVINKPLGLSPPTIEFKRAHLFDINAVGFGAMVIATIVALASYAGSFGETAGALSSFIALGVSVALVPLLALATKSRFYIARQGPSDWANAEQIGCCVCEHMFEPEDMTNCPVYAGPICSLCCSLDARCQDACKEKSRLSDQFASLLASVLPQPLIARFNSSLGQYLALLVAVGSIIAAVLGIVYWQTIYETALPTELVSELLIKVFIILLLITGVVCWLFVLAHESRVVAQEESQRQTILLTNEIIAHEETDRALQKAKEAAEAANLAKSRYVVGISHELRTPLNAILGYAQLIERDPNLPESRRNAIRTIRRSGEHLAGLVEGLLDVAKIEAGRLKLARDEIRLPEFLDQIVDMFRLQADAKGIKFVFDRQERLPAAIRSDEKRLRQILINLLSNAIKFTEQGEVRLKVRHRNQVAEFVIEDTGIGIAPEDLERVFMPFERIERAGGTWIPGTGLGLTITKLLCEIMGGEITLQSTPGQGSSFTVRLHLASVHAIAPPKPDQALIKGYEGPRITILVCDDEPSHRELLEDILRPLGFIVFPVPDGATCLRLADELHPDVVVLDVSMPQMNGWQVARQLRENGAVATRIVMISADAAEEKRERRPIGDHDGYLVKPIDVSVLLDTIRRLTGITWIEKGYVEVAQERPAQLKLSRTEIPSERGLMDLARLVEIGYLRGLGARLDEIERTEPQAARFVAQLRKHVAALELDKVASIIEECREPADAG